MHYSDQKKMEPEIVAKKRNYGGHSTVFCRDPGSVTQQIRTKKGSRECAVDGLWYAGE